VVRVPADNAMIKVARIFFIGASWLNRVLLQRDPPEGVDSFITLTLDICKHV